MIGTLQYMNAQQENHLADIKNKFAELVDTKYRKGQAEHGGDLWELGPVQILDCALDEAIDQVTYLLTLRDKITGRIKI